MTTAVFNCNWNCNDDCNFCFNKSFLNKTPLLSLEETQLNYVYAKKKFDIKNIIISGGEPSLHPDFWRLMVFFYYKVDSDVRPALNTNGILFSNTKLLKKLQRLVSLSPLPRKQISLSFSNIAHPDFPKNKKESMKIEGIGNILATDFGNTRIFLSVIITRDNYRQLSQIADFIERNASKGNKQHVCIDIRYVFIGLKVRKTGELRLSKEEYEEVMPASFEETRPFIEEFIIQLAAYGYTLSLKNIPICSLSFRLHTIPFVSYLGEKRINIQYDQQCDNIIPPGSFFDENTNITLKEPSCNTCSKKYMCSIEKEYKENGIFVDFKNIP